MVVVVLQPLGELGELRLVARAQQALGVDIAHQGLVLELGDLAVGLGELAGGLGLEDAPVAVALVTLEHGRQVGDHGHLVELDDRRRRHEHRTARDDGGMSTGLLGRGGGGGRLGSGWLWRGRIDECRLGSRTGSGRAGGRIVRGRGLGRFGLGLGQSLCRQHRRCSEQDDRDDMFHSDTVVALGIGRQAPDGYTGRQTEDQMTLHQERAAAVRRLVDESRAIEKTGVTRANLEKIGGLLASLAGRAELFPQEEFPLGRRRRHLSPGRGSRPSLRALCLGRRRRQEGAAAQSHDLGDHRGRPRRRAQRRLRPPRQRRARGFGAAARGAGQGEDAAPRRRHLLPARGLPSHRDAGRLGQRAASSLLWAEPGAPARPRVGRHGDGQCQALHGQGEDPDAAARREAGQGDAEVGRDLRLLRRARGRRVLAAGPSAVRHAAAAVAAGAARFRPAARSAHPHRADGQRR